MATPFMLTLMQAQQHSVPQPWELLPGLIPCLCLPCGGLFGVAVLAFWVWMLVDCITKEPNNPTDNIKIIWILVIVLTSWIGALLYLLIRRPERKRLHGQ